MAVESTMIALGTPAPAFELPNPSAGLVGLADFDAAPALVVVFMCNHCPYVQRVAAGLAQLGTDLAERGVAMVGISSNDVARYPQDGPEAMAQQPAGDRGRRSRRRRRGAGRHAGPARSNSRHGLRHQVEARYRTRLLSCPTRSPQPVS
jgi:hypothetical protein